MQRVNTSPQEETEQIAVVQYCKYAGIPIYAVPNGGSRNRLEAIHLKQQGVSPGVPDLVIPLACSGFHGLYIEMKREKGSKTSQAQKDWIAILTENGYCARICKGFDEARQLIDNYRGGKLKSETEKPHAVEVEVVKQVIRSAQRQKPSVVKVRQFICSECGERLKIADFAEPGFDIYCETCKAYRKIKE